MSTSHICVSETSMAQRSPSVSRRVCYGCLSHALACCLGALCAGFAIEARWPFDFKDCQLSSWWQEQPCSVSCGGGMEVLRRSVVKGNCPAASSPDRIITRSCSPQSCPAEVCNVCDIIVLDGSDHHCRLLMDVRWDDFLGVASSVTADWDSTIGGRPVHWSIKLSGPIIGKVSRSVVITDLKTQHLSEKHLTANLPDEDAEKWWHASWESVLMDFGTTMMGCRYIGVDVGQTRVVNSSTSTMSSRIV
eukprot:TRINITY_DN97319_c0_g1_i1.p1 TRINITY_DN97319_c0_g1~~TRINITY_DN97319_c0_g1_i1.p1  ORF type:complete len:248 (+),score=22.18 TRINITY_DN97319_c0_g1_i1:1-744(+)